MTTMDRPFEILLVEDNPGDVIMTRRAFRRAQTPVNLSVTSDGVQAMDFLWRRGEYAGAPRPDIILLDLNMPKKDGREVLAEIKADVGLKLIPVIVLTTSDAEQDVRTCYELHANCYVTKQIDLDDFMSVMQNFENFWLNDVRLPSND